MPQNEYQMFQNLVSEVSVSLSKFAEILGLKRFDRMYIVSVFEQTINMLSKTYSIAKKSTSMQLK